MASFALGLETHQVSATAMMSPQGFTGSPYLPIKVYNIVPYVQNAICAQQKEIPKERKKEEKRLEVL